VEGSTVAVRDVQGGAGWTCAAIRVGRLMVRHVEQRLGAAGVEFLQVKTLSASRPDAGYERTRAFWLACGFRPLEEFPTLWDPANPALQLIKIVGAR
jgi:hypothetical protein